MAILGLELAAGHPNRRGPRRLFDDLPRLLFEARAARCLLLAPTATDAHQRKNGKDETRETQRTQRKARGRTETPPGTVRVAACSFPYPLSSWCRGDYSREQPLFPEAITEQRPECLDRIPGPDLLAGVEGARRIVDRHLVDRDTAAPHPGSDLRAKLKAAAGER